jgi:hypothetical protein
MSISQIIKPNRFLKMISIVKEIAQRELLTIGVKQKVFFPYRASFIHPAFNESKNNPPLHYVNKHNARLFHYIQGANQTGIEENHIIEVIDHALSLLAPYNGYALTCQEYVEQVPIAKKLYDSPKLTKILFTSEGQRKVFRRYFPDDELFKKTKVLPLAWHDNTDKAKKQFDKDRNFLFIASHYQTKGVAIVLDAWGRYVASNPNATLTLVSHDIPKEIEHQLHSSITLIKQAPLSKVLKEQLYTTSDVAIATTLTDGVTPIEATSYGKPVIVFRAQHSEDFINRENGILVDVPINIYDEGYGIEWKTNDEYLTHLELYYEEGRFQTTIEKLVDAFRFFDDPRNMSKFTQNAIKKYHEYYRVELRNKVLIELYGGCYE